MAGIQIRYTIDATDTLSLLDKCRKLGLDMKIPLQNAGIYAMGRQDKHFQREEGPGGVGWTPLSPATERRRRTGKKKRRNKILQDTGRLRMSIIGGAPDHIERLSNYNFEFGTSLIYAAIHQFGGVLSVVNPARMMTVRHKLTKGGKIRGFAKRGEKRVREIQVMRKASKSRVTIPKRPFLYLEEKDSKVIDRILKDWVENELKHWWRKF